MNRRRIEMKDESRGCSLPVRVLYVAVALISFALVPGCKREAAPEAEVAVQAAHPEQGPIAAEIVADAVLAPVAQAAIEPKISAPVARFLVERGARVKAGQLLAVLENKDLTAAAMDNKGSYMAAQATFDATTKATAPEDMLKAQSDLDQAKANLELDQSIVKSRKQLFAEGAIPGRDLDTAQATLVQAQAAYDAAAKHLESMKGVSHAATLQAAQGQLTSAEGRLKGADAQVSYSEIRSPIDGVVTERPLFAGETATAGTPLITVMETSTLIAKAHVDVSLARQLKVGEEAEVQPLGSSNPVEGTVSLVSPATDPGSTTVEVWIRISNKSGALIVGTPVKVTVSGASVAQALKIPASAVLPGEDGSKSVMVIAGDGTAQRKKVELGISGDGDVQVLSGLSPSDMVITQGSYGLDEGTKVKQAAAGSDAPDAKGGGDN
jgi:HlyD family secretion protein